MRDWVRLRGARSWDELDSQQIEGTLLQRRGAGGLLEGGGMDGRGLAGVANDRGEVCQQGAEAVHGQPVSGSLALGLGSGRRGRLRRGDDRATRFLCPLAIVVVEENRRQIAAHVPLDVVGEHAEKDVAAYPVLEAVMNRADLQIHGLDRAKRALDGGQ